MSYVVHHERTFAVSTNVLWDLVSDHCQMHRWFVPGMRIHLEQKGCPPPNGAGAIRVFEQAGFVVKEKVLAFEPPHRMTYTVLRGFPIANHLGEIHLQPCDSKTRLSWTVSFDERYPATGWLLKHMINYLLYRGLRRLSHIL